MRRPRDLRHAARLACTLIGCWVVCGYVVEAGDMLWQALR